MITVKPLIWTLRIDEMTLTIWNTPEPQGETLFEINRYGGDKRYHLSRRHVDALWRKSYPTLEEAQAAAQSMWDAFIRAAIQP